MPYFVDTVEEISALLSTELFAVERGVDFEEQRDGHFEGEKWVPEKVQAVTAEGVPLWKLAVRVLERTSSGKKRRVDRALVIAAPKCPSVADVLLNMEVGV